MKRQPKGSPGGGQFAPDARGKNPPAADAGKKGGKASTGASTPDYAGMHARIRAVLASVPTYAEDEDGTLVPVGSIALPTPGERGTHASIPTYIEGEDGVLIPADEATKLPTQATRG